MFTPLHIWHHPHFLQLSIGHTLFPLSLSLLHCQKVLVQNATSTIDLYPTLLELANLTVPDGLDGHSLLPFMFEDRTSSNLFIFPFRTYTHTGWKNVLHNTRQSVLLCQFRFPVSLRTCSAKIEFKLLLCKFCAVWLSCISVFLRVSYVFSSCFLRVFFAFSSCSLIQLEHAYTMYKAFTHLHLFSLPLRRERGSSRLHIWRVPLQRK